jgi:hypothetical protein
MFIDAFLVFDQGAYSATTGMTGVAQFASGATTVSTNVLDMINNRDMGDAPSGPGELSVNFEVTAAYSGGTSVNFQLQGSTDNTTWTTYAETGAVPIASLGVGALLSFGLPPVNPDAGAIPRYYRTAYVNAGANTAGSVIAWLGARTYNQYYKPGIVVNN